MRGGRASSRRKGRTFRGTAIIRNQRGLHARAAAVFVKVAGTFDVEVSVSKGDLTVSGHSILGLMMLAAASGNALELIATGPDAKQAVAALTALIENMFEDH